MSGRRNSEAVTAAAVALLLVAVASGCGSAQAEPLDVTYYYLPG
jgi:hypothetical protein